MKIVHVSRFDGGDGASNAAYRLHRALLELGIDSRMFVAEHRGEMNGDPTVVLFKPPRDLPSRLRRRWRRMRIDRDFGRYRARPRGHEAFSDDRTRHGADILAQLPPADVINVHAMYQFVDYRAFLAVAPKEAVVVRTLHDMNFFTGGCHIAGGCGRYTERCGACPQLGSGNEQDLSRQIWERKRSALRGVGTGRLYVVAPSRWLATEARRSSLLRDFPISVIPFGVDTQIFSPRDKGFAREVLGIPQEKRVILFVAESVTRPIKRFGMLAEALNGLTELPDLLLVSVGSGRPEVEVRIPHLRLGQVASERLLSLVYSAADLLVLPSFRENLPLVVLEAMACGTPVVGSAVGGIPDMVRPEVTGRLFPVDDVATLRTTIHGLLDEPARRAAMAATCRRIAVEEYSLQSYARRYADFYETILAGRTPPEQFDRAGPARHEAVSVGSQPRRVTGSGRA